MTNTIRRVGAEKYGYYVNKLRQNVGLETWLWRQIVTSQTAHTKYKWPPFATEWKKNMKIFCVRNCIRGPYFHAFQTNDEIGHICLGPTKLRWPRAPRSLNPSLPAPKGARAPSTYRSKLTLIVYSAGAGPSVYQVALRDQNGSHIFQRSLNT